MALSETVVANMALARLGAKRLNDLTNDQSVEAIQARMFYGQTRDALLRSHSWGFAIKREILSEDTTTPVFEWDHAYLLPSDCLRAVSLYDTSASYAIEGERLLTNDDEANLIYIRKVTDPTEFDSLFVEVLVLKLSLELCMPLKNDQALRQSIWQELAMATSRARLINLRETNTRNPGITWNESRRINVGST
jgi:hypothetical protein